jgi:hypothetical protein
MRKLCTAAIAVSLFASSMAWADTTLAPGKPAGVHKAQMGTKEVLIFGGIAVAAVVLIAVNSGGGDPLKQPLQGTASVGSTNP